MIKEGPTYEELLAENTILNEHKISNENYRAIFENMWEGFAHCKLLYEENEPNDFIYIEVNKAFYHQTGLTQVTGKKISEILPNHKRENKELFKLYIRVSQTGKSEKIETFVPELGKWFYLSVFSIKKDHFFVIFNNITNRKQNELQLINHEKQLETLNETKDKLISIIAHDLRNPFNSIIGFSELLIEEVEHFEIEKIKRFSKIINTSSVNTLNLLDNLLHWAKTQTNQLNFSPEKIEISSIINEVLKTLESTAKFKNISLNYYQKNPNLVVHADLNMLKTILRNLISNSLKFTKSEGFIHIYTKNINNQVEIVIEDNGIGMNEATRANLFKIHKDSTLGTANEKGSGLGLLLCKELIEKHKGEIFIESEEGKGTTFKFTLPID